MVEKACGRTGRGRTVRAVAAGAADLNTNLVINGDFEVVNIDSTQGGYNAVEILLWNDGTRIGFAYSHDGSLNSGGANTFPITPMAAH